MSQRWSNLLVWAGTIAFVVFVSKAAWAGNPVNGTSLHQPGRLRAAARGHLRDVGERARRRVHDDRRLQLRPGRDRHVLRVRRLGAHGRPRRAAADRAAARRARARAAVRDRARPRDHAPPAGQAARRAAHGDGRPDVRVHRSREHDLEPARRALDARALRRARLPHRRRAAHVAPVHHDRRRGRARDRPAHPAVPDAHRRRDARRRRQPRSRRARRRPLGGALELLVGARLLARGAGRHPARARDGRHVDDDADAARSSPRSRPRSSAASAACRSRTSAR